MLTSAYSYQLELYSGDWSALGRALLKVDWEPAREWTRFAAVRAGRLAVSAVGEHATIEPIWHEEAGEPWVEGFRLTLDLEGAGTVDHAFDTGYFARSAMTAVEALAERAGLEPPGRARYLTFAYPAPDVPREAETPGFVAREVASGASLLDKSLVEMAARATARGEPTDDDVPAFLPQSVLDEAAGLTAAAGGRETGGILVGHLCRDPVHGEIFVEVTAQIPARHTEADQARLTFTAATWTGVRHALALRGRGEVMLGWWHSHPVREWRARAGAPGAGECAAADGFLSADDRALHRAVFPRAYSLALVVTDAGRGDPTFALFGWREGVLERRGFGAVPCDGDRALAR